MEKIKVEELKESVNETGEEKGKIIKQKAREVTDAAASAKNDEVNDKITKQKAREVTDAAASAKNDEENDKITKQKAREVTNAAASAQKDDGETDSIAKPKDEKVKLIKLELIADHSSIKSSMLPQKTDKLDSKNMKCKLEPQNSKDKNRKGKSNVKDLDKMQEKNVEKEKVLQDVNRGKGKSIKVEKQKANESAQDKYEKKKKIVQNKTIGDTAEDEEKKTLNENKDKELTNDENSEANKPGIFAMRPPRKEKHYQNVKLHDKSKDILADISKRARKESVEPKKVDKNIGVARDITKSPKSSDHLFMKIAGRAISNENKIINIKSYKLSMKMKESDRDRAVRPTALIRTCTSLHSRDRPLPLSQVMTDRSEETSKQRNKYDHSNLNERELNFGPGNVAPLYGIYPKTGLDCLVRVRRAKVNTWFECREASPTFSWI